MTTANIEESLKQYSEFKKICQEAEKQMAEMADWIIGYMDGKEIQELDSEHGKFKIGERATWTFTDKIKELKEVVKNAEEAEKKDGTAKSKTSRFLTVKLK